MAINSPNIPNSPAEILSTLPPYLSATQICELFAISKPTLYECIERGLLEQAQGGIQND